METVSSPLPETPTQPSSHNVLFQLVMKIVVISLVGFFLFANLANYPTISGWDEGMYLQFAHNLAENGEYATRNGDGFDRLIPPGGTGLTLIAPVALALNLSNNSLLAARLIISIFFVGALFGIYLLIRNIRNTTAALIAVPLLLIAGYQIYDALWAGRQVLAELPALAFLSFGLYTWQRSMVDRSLRWILFSAVLLGLTVITKNQLIWVVTGSFFIVAAADFFYYKKLTWIQRLAPLAGLVLGYGLWFVVSLLMIEPEKRAAYLQMQSALADASFFHPSLGRISQNIRFFLKSGQWLVSSIAVIYGLFRSRTRSIDGLQRFILPLITSVLFLNFFVLSITWARYLLFPLIFSSLCSAIMIEEAISWASKRWKLTAIIQSILLVLIVVVLAGPRLVENAQRITTTQNYDAEIFATMVDEQFSPDVKILNWEWEVDFYSTHKFVRPSALIFAAKINQVYNQISNPLLEQPQISDDIQYVIVGPFTESITLFDNDLQRLPHQLVFEKGPYKLYKLE